MSLQNKVAVVTVAGSGIGRAISRQLARDGAAIAVWDVNGAAADETVVLIKQGNGRAIACAVDASSPEGIASALARLVTHREYRTSGTHAGRKGRNRHTPGSHQGATKS